MTIPTANDDMADRAWSIRRRNSIAVLANDSSLNRTRPEVLDRSTPCPACPLNWRHSDRRWHQMDAASIYSPPADTTVGTDTFTYTISDGNGGTGYCHRCASTSSSTCLPPQVAFTFTITDGTGGVLTDVSVGQSFLLNVFVEDVRNLPRGVFSAYLDVNWAQSDGNASVDGAFMYGPLYGSAPSGEYIAANNEIDELGAVDGIDESLHDGVELLVSIPFLATTAGTITFTGNPADDVPPNEVTIYGQSEIVLETQQFFDQVSVRFRIQLRCSCKTTAILST